MSRSSLKAIASRTIGKPNNSDDLMHHKADTQDIIDVILYADGFLGADTKMFSTHIPGNTIHDRLYNIWQFVRKHIRYVEDKPGYELIKSPAKTWKDRQGDCKSMSIFIASLLLNLGIKYKYRFAAYEKGDVTHVYVVALIDNEEIILDAVHSEFDEEEPYHHIKEYKMTQVNYLHGTPTSQSEGQSQDNIPARSVKPSFIDFGGMTDGELMLNLLDQELEMVIAYYGDTNGVYNQGRTLIATYLKAGLHDPNVSGIHGKLPKSIEYLADQINRARKKTRPAGGIFTSGPAFRVIDSSVAISGTIVTDRDLATESYPCEEKDGGEWVYLYTDTSEDEDFFEFKPKNPKAYKECLLKERWIPLLNKHLEGSSPHFLYSFMGNENTTQVVSNKRHDHRQVVGVLQQLSGLSEETIKQWMSNGILRYSSQRKKLGLKTPQDMISILKSAPEVDNEAHVGDIIAILTIVVAILGAAAELANSLKKQPSVREQLDNVNRNIGGLTFGPERDDFNGNTSSLSSMTPMLALAAGAFVLLGDN